MTTTTPLAPFLQSLTTSSPEVIAAQAAGLGEAELFPELEGPALRELASRQVKAETVKHKFRAFNAGMGHLSYGPDEVKRICDVIDELCL